jgi:excisionase family DNA binding protein
MELAVEGRMTLSWMMGAESPGHADELAALVSDPLKVSEVALEAIPMLLTRLALEQTRLSALQTALATRLLSGRLSNHASLPSAETSETLGLAELARLLQKSTSWVRRAVRRGELRFARRVGRSLVFPREEVQRYLEQSLPCYEAAPNPLTSCERRADPPMQRGWRVSAGKEDGHER